MNEYFQNSACQRTPRVYSGVQCYMFAAVACQHGNSCQSLSIQVEQQEEEINRLLLPALVRYEARPVTRHALKLCHTLLGTREGIQIGRGKPETPQVIKPAARHLPTHTHTHSAQVGTNRNTHVNECIRSGPQIKGNANMNDWWWLAHLHTHYTQRSPLITGFCLDATWWQMLKDAF